MSRHQAAVRARMHDSVPNLLPIEYRNSPPLVVWRHSPCNSRILRLYLVPEGWMLVTDDVRVSLEEWVQRAGIEYSVDDFRAGRVAAFSKREVKGHERLLPHETHEWPEGSFEIGCRKHGLAPYVLTDLASDADEARRTRRRVERSKLPSTV